jgi:hypothetical protein
MLSAPIARPSLQAQLRTPTVTRNYEEFSTCLGATAQSVCGLWKGLDELLEEFDGLSGSTLQ